VYVKDSNTIIYCTSLVFKLEKCSFNAYEIPEVMSSNFTHVAATYNNIYIHFYNNHAHIAGSAVYGNSMDICNIHVQYKSTSDSGTKYLPMHDLYKLELEANSDPFKVCQCEDGIPNCKTSKLFRQVYAVELHRIPVVAVGQRNGVVPAVI